MRGVVRVVSLAVHPGQRGHVPASVLAHRRHGRLIQENAVLDAADAGFGGRGRRAGRVRVGEHVATAPACLVDQRGQLPAGRGDVAAHAHRPQRAVGADLDPVGPRAHHAPDRGPGAVRSVEQRVRQ